MIFCCSDKRNLCDDYSCEVTKTDNGIQVSFSSESKEKVEQLHKMTDSCSPLCCDDDKSNSCC